MSIQSRMVRLLEAAALTPEQKADIDTVYKLSAGLRKAKQNPWVSGPGMGGTYSVVFKTPNNSTEALFWTGDGFKDLSRARGEPEDFASKQEAEKRIKSEILDFIRKWRADEAHLIIGW